MLLLFMMLVTTGCCAISGGWVLIGLADLFWLIFPDGASDPEFVRLGLDMRL